LQIVIVRLLCFQGTMILYNVLLSVQLHIFPAADQVWITELTLIYRNVRSVRNLHAQELTLILKIIGQCDVEHILTSPIKTIMPTELAAILAIMSLSTFQTAVILYLLHMRFTLSFVLIRRLSKKYVRLWRRFYCDITQWNKRLFYLIKCRFFFHLEIPVCFNDHIVCNKANYHIVISNNVNFAHT
jgi:hypothetical protein